MSIVCRFYPVVLSLPSLSNAFSFLDVPLYGRGRFLFWSNNARYSSLYRYKTVRREIVCFSKIWIREVLARIFYSVSCSLCPDLFLFCSFMIVQGCFLFYSFLFLN